MQHVLCTGNLCSKDTHDFLRTLAPSVHIVKGDMDEVPTFPENTVVTIGQFKIGICHGHQIVPWGDHESLGILARQLDVDILITGHTHVNETMEMDGRWFINPGSITGSYSGFQSDVKPSFICMSIQGNKVVNYVYELNGDEVEVHKTQFQKGGSSA